MQKVCWVLLALLLGCASETRLVDPDWVSVNAEVIYPKIRNWTSPSSGEIPDFNSPSLQWPSSRRAIYSVRLARDKDFSLDVIEQNGIPFAIYNPHQKLREGQWFWQYKTNGGVWNEVDSFMITSSIPEFITPTTGALVAKVPAEHPRILVRKSELELFRKKTQLYKESVAIIEEANHYLGMLPPSESDALPTYTGKDDFENKKIALLASRWVGWNLYVALELLSQAYVLTGDVKYFETARTWMLEASTWDPRGPTHSNNFGDSGVMAGLALGLDTFWDLLSSDERDGIIRQVSARADQFYEIWTNQVESRSSSMHVWQHILHRMLYTSLALINEVPEAEQWMEYIYELWIAQSPKMGEKDGAWFNGISYFRMNTLTLYDVNTVLKELSGVDFMWPSWYRNNPEWLIYAFPPKSVADGFCNDGGKYSQPTIKYAGYMDAAASIFNNPYASWYAEEVAKSLGSAIQEDEEFRWYRIRYGYDRPSPKPVQKFDLPQAARFPDVGVAYMHTTLENTETNLMLSVRSTPFGPLAHAHADQNTFNIAFGGKRLFYNTGYRPAMGDPHFLGWYKDTRGHNGILIDGEGQPFDEGAYGWLPRFLHGKQISYVAGDATNAYSGSKQEKKDLGLKKFRRHYLMLRPSIIVIYDELEADHPVGWSWLLHNDDGFEIAGNTLKASNKAADAKVTLFASDPIDFHLTDQFSIPVENWTNKVDEEGDTAVFDDQWHFSGVSTTKTEKMRFLAVFQVKADGMLDQVKISSDGIYEIEDWQITAVMDSKKEAVISVKKNDGSASFCSQGALTTSKKSLGSTNSGSSKLMEIIAGEAVYLESKDDVPAAIERATKLNSLNF
ncbi:MAG: DUF4962 domain-containing protein [Cyclobacteriaceae bacterium]